MKIKFSSDDRLTLNKAMETSDMIRVVRAIFLESNKYYPQDFLITVNCRHYFLLLSDKI